MQDHAWPRGCGPKQSFASSGVTSMDDAASSTVRGTAPALFFIVRFDHGLLDTVDGEDVGVVVEVAAGVGDVHASGKAKRVHRQVPEGGYVPGGRAGPQL
jgi:hypothetical protein